MLLKKSLSEIASETERRLEGLGITENNPGGVARIITTVVNEQISSMYDVLEQNMLQGFVSTAGDIFLQKIGLLLNCHKGIDEDVEDYRYRITKQIENVATSNIVAIRLAILSVEGVQDVMLKRFTHGTGSFSAYVITADRVTPQYILDEVNSKIQMGVEGFGVRGEAFSPKPVDVEMKIRLVFGRGITEVDRKLIVSQAEEAIKLYVNTRNVGEPLVIESIYETIRAISEGIEEIIIFQYKINGFPVRNTDQTCAWNQRFVESVKENAIRVMPLGG